MLAVSDQVSYFEQENLIALDEEEQNRWENETISAFAVQNGNFLIDICMRSTSPKVSFPLFTRTRFPCIWHLSSCLIRRNVNPH